MDLEVKGVAASPRRQAQLSLRGKKRQGWRPDTQATHGPRPPEVPCLDLGRLGDSDEEVSRKSCQKKIEHSVLEQKTIPENLPSPTDRYKLKYHQYEADMKEEYKQYSQRTAEKKKDHLQCPGASIKTYKKDIYRRNKVNLKLKK
ncbi:PREDICTED: calcyphosin-2-like [Merops nubicus]|uniref:calcyphosin-2-like n=1 Tax=Merops nubicus TaxID=57421 RepID=UPI0004F026C8|nr:PREDICTED: calcyphosin-2-like [Merops nubicus]